MREENEMTEVNVYIAKIYAITKPEKAKEIVENAKKKSKTSGLSYKEVLSEEFINLLDSPEKEDNKKNYGNEFQWKNRRYKYDAIKCRKICIRKTDIYSSMDL